MSTTVSEAIRKTVLVDFTPEEAFDLFTARIASWWPVRSHSYGGDEVKEVVLEPHVGGRLYEVTAEGEQDWGSVLAWEPPTRLLLDWHIGEHQLVLAAFADQLFDVGHRLGQLQLVERQILQPLFLVQQRRRQHGIEGHARHWHTGMFQHLDIELSVVAVFGQLGIGEERP